MPATAQNPSFSWVKAPLDLVFNLSPELLSIYLRIQSFDRGRGCWASLKTLGGNTHCVRQVRRHVRKLAELGYISVERRPGGTLFIKLLDRQALESAPDADVPPTPDMDVRTPPGHGCPPNKNKEEIEKKEKEQLQETVPDQVEGPGAVVASFENFETGDQIEPDQEAGQVLSLHLPDDLAELPRKRRGLSGAVLRRLVAQHGVEKVQQAAKVVCHQYPSDVGVKSFGGLLTVAIRDGWTMPENVAASAEKEAEKARCEEAAPPPGARWAILKSSGKRYPIEEIRSDHVRTDRFVIPRHQWPDWVWIESDG